MKSLTVYTRQQCHLCEVLLRELVPLAAERADIRVVDIDTDPVLREQYSLRIPVLVGEHGELSTYPLDRDAVDRYLMD